MMHMRLLPVFLGAFATAFAATFDARDIESTLAARHEDIAARGGGGLPRGWSVVSACAADFGAQRVFVPKQGSLPRLTLERNVFENNTPAKCASKCAEDGFGYASVRMGVECWCSSQQPKIVGKNKKQCSQTCGGDDSQTCGSPTTAQVYVNWSLVGKKRPGVGTPRLTNGWSVAFKCVQDPTVGEVYLKGTDVFELQNNSPLACTKLCGQKGYDLAGVEYSNECMCGHGWKGASKPVQKDAKECNMSCTGDKTLTCGGGNRVQFYKHKSFKRHNSTLVFDEPLYE